MAGNSAREGARSHRGFPGGQQDRHLQWGGPIPPPAARSRADGRQPETALVPSTGCFPGGGDRPKLDRDGGWGQDQAQQKNPRFGTAPAWPHRAMGIEIGPKLVLVQWAPWPSQTGLWRTRDWPSCGIAGAQPGGPRDWHGVLGQEYGWEDPWGLARDCQDWEYLQAHYIIWCVLNQKIFLTKKKLPTNKMN